MMAARSGQAMAARNALARGDIHGTQRLAATLVSANPGDA